LLLGAYFEKDAAIEAAKVFFDKKKTEDNVTDNTDMTDTIGERGDILSCEFDDSYYYIAMDAFVLNDDFVEEEVPFRGDTGIYQQLSIHDFKEVECKRQCIECKVEKSVKFYCKVRVEETRRRPSLRRMPAKNDKNLLELQCRKEIRMLFARRVVQPGEWPDLY
jgi:hypothetical protein